VSFPIAGVNVIFILEKLEGMNKSEKARNPAFGVPREST
jgi:hypothetical protein